jgi:hypothetical protein
MPVFTQEADRLNHRMLTFFEHRSVPVIDGL